MTFCTNCGETLPKEANFCPKCGWKAPQSSGAGVYTASDEFRESMSKMSVELEKAFNIAAKEIHKAFQTAKNNIQEATATSKDPITCPNCGEKNQPQATYCAKCGTKLKN
jgi:ribosomal protein L40E